LRLRRSPITGETKTAIKRGIPQKEELFELIIESSTDFAIFTMDANGLTTSWNIGAERLFGYAEDEIIGVTADVIFVPEERKAGVPEQERSQARLKGRALDERWHLRKDGSQFWASGLMMPLKNRDEGFVKIARDRTEQHRAEERLRQNEERFRLLATSIPQLVFRTLPDGNRIWGSPQWIDFTGLSLEQSLGFGWMDAVHPDDREATQRAWHDAQQTNAYYIEHRIRRAADGGYRWHQTRALPIDAPNSAASDWVGTMTDVHDLRELQDRQLVLMGELEHRTRNLLAVVRSIANQTISTSHSLDTFRAEFEKRLGALGRVQSLLARADHPEVSLHTIIQAELAALGDSEIESGSITLDGPPIMLPATSVQTISLALHELATNAVKYGALAQPSGRLAVTWRPMIEDDNACVLLEWRESGVMMTESQSPRRKGYGSELILRALPYQLKAKTKLEFGPEGVFCEIVVPVRAAPEMKHG
jgi:PAS domain S-box-containing protein